MIEQLPRQALSLRQPWAWLVLHGKSIENRHWNTGFSGQFWIHASKGMTKREYYDALEFARGAGFAVESMPPLGAVLRGGIVGRARLVDVMHPGGLSDSRVYPSAQAAQRAHPRKGDPWHMPEQFGFILQDVREVPFVACSGALGFFRVPEPVLEQLGRAG